MTPLERFNEKRHTIAEIWEATGRRCPLLVRFYDQGEGVATLVTQVASGKAYGFPLRDGLRTATAWYGEGARGSVRIPDDATPDWKLAGMPFDDMDAVFFRMDLHGEIDPQPETAAELGIDPGIDRDAVIPFGKYSGKTVADVVRKDPGYLEWALRNISAMDAIVHGKRRAA